MVAAVNQSSKTPRQCLRSLLENLQRRVESTPEHELWALAEATRQHAAIIAAECQCLAAADEWEVRR